MGSGPFGGKRTQLIDPTKKKQAQGDIQAELRAQIEAGRTGSQTGLLAQEEKRLEGQAAFETRGSTRKLANEVRGRTNEIAGAANALRNSESKKEEDLVRKRQRQLEIRRRKPGRRAAILGGRKTLVS